MCDGDKLLHVMKYSIEIIVLCVLAVLINICVIYICVNYTNVLHLSDKNDWALVKQVNLYTCLIVYFNRLFRYILHTVCK